ncbi:MAG: GMC family oxidoreductase [Labilithrix sp.]|nr:GMC family oxidoreductase [Labilithrix sp.]MCW5809958.1 GMC family oxidoreductase [Labilithrix sp.]
MLLDARTLAANSVLRADICIIGAGAAGITLALELEGAGLSVCVLESGGLVVTEPNKDLTRGRVLGIETWQPDETRARVLGGTTALWSGWCRPLMREDFEPRPYIPDSGWPFGYDDLLPYYARAHQTVEIGEMEYDPEVLARTADRPLLPLEPSGLETRVYRFSPPTRFGERYRSRLDGAADVRVYLNANLRKLRLARRGAPISHLECATLDGGRFTVEAGRYVLALGGIENARLLLCSNDEQPEGIANGSGRVGEFLEHPHLYGSGSILWKDAPNLDFYGGLPVRSTVNGVPRDVRVIGAIGIKAPVRASEGLPNLSATLATVPLDTPSGVIGLDTAAALLGRKGVLGAAQMTYRCEQTIAPDSRVMLGADLDALGMPRVELHWNLSEENRSAIRRSLGVFARELGRLGLGRLWDVHLTDAPLVPAGGAHHMGTARMSRDPAKGVVDENGRAHEVENLYVAGGAVFPSGGDSNPTLTIVALAHRLADHLKGAKA